LAQHDLKRLLAYHSVENIGIIVLGIGLGVVGVQQSQPFWAVLGFTASFLHIWNHALFKSLLFLAGGSVLHATGIRMIDRLGGLIKSMPYTSSFFLLGAVAIVGLPPLNGFVSEFLLYLGLLQGSIHAGADGGNLTGILCAASFALLAFAGALALACFAKVFGVAFLGKERSKDVERAHECLLFMKGGMFVLALGCVAIGLFPKIILPLFESAVSTQASSLEARDLSSVISPIQTSSLIVAILIFVMFFAFKKFVRVSPKKVSTWGCGYTLPNSKLQYSASSFAEMLTGTFAIFIAQTLRFRPIEKTFPDESSFHSGSRDLVLTFFIVPLSRVVEFASAKLRILQQGKVQAYVFYIAFTLVFVLIVSIYQW